LSSRTLLAPSPATRFADAVLHLEALTCRLGEGRPPRDFAGMFVDHADVDRILAGLPGLDGPDLATLESELAPAREAVDAARHALHSWLASDDEFCAWVRFAALDAESAEVLAVITAVAADLPRQQLVAYIQDSVQLPLCTAWLLRRLFPRPHHGPYAALAGGALWRAGLVETVGEGPFARRQFAPADAFVTALTGAILESPPGIVIGEGDAPPGLTLVPGPDRVRRLAVAAAAGAHLVTDPPTDDPGWLQLVRAATVSRVGVMLDPIRDLSAEGRTWIERTDHLSWVLGSATELPLDILPQRPWHEQAADRGRVVGSDGWSLTATQAHLASIAQTAYGGDRARAIRRLAGGHLDTLATRIIPRRGIDDLVLPADEKAQLAELTARYRHRLTVYEDWGFRALPSSGLVALFAGPSGTGKTLAAEVVAGRLSLDVFKIDLSAVVSKYIGETEKNISRVFDAAEAGRVLLFFDEADALFGKRSDVSDAHDRYANIEVSYLLQRLEAYDGLVVLATNLAKNIDQAFLRRVHVSVEFPLPDEQARLDIWHKSFPSSAPVGMLDFEFLAANFRLTGGGIRNAALAGAFLAAEAGAPIGMAHVVMGIKREFQKLGRLRTREEFGDYFEMVESVSPNGGSRAEPA
jgi:hypothetical protein